MLEIRDRCEMMSQAPTVTGVLQFLAFAYYLNSEEGEASPMPGDMYNDLGPNDRLVQVPLGKELTKIVKDLASTVSRNTTRRRAPKSA
jgi:hypothetical protein